MKTNGDVENSSEDSTKIQNNEASPSLLSSQHESSSSSSTNDTKLYIKLKKLNEQEFENLKNRMTENEAEITNSHGTLEQQQLFSKKSSNFAHELHTVNTHHLKEIKSNQTNIADDVAGNPCKCKKKGRSFNCSRCTRNYPIHVRRTVCGDIDTYGVCLSAMNSSSNNNYNNSFKKSNQMSKLASVSTSISSSSLSSSSSASFPSYSHDSETNPLVKSDKSSDESSLSSSSSSSSTSSKHLTKSISSSLKLKPSPIPVSSTLISLLNLNNRSNNNFAPPPNINIALFQSGKK